MKTVILKIAQYLVGNDSHKNDDPVRDDYCICGAPKLPTNRRHHEASLDHKNSSQRNYSPFDLPAADTLGQRNAGC
jgi:hypothetical protein